MELFKLPNSAKVNKIIPKNAFDGFISGRQKRLLSELIARITWTHKLSPETTNLEAKEIKEIQLFKIELKVKQDIQLVLDIIDKSIPYNIIFVLEYENFIYVSTSSKHPNPANENNAVIDWTFKTDWFEATNCTYSIILKKSIDAVYQNFCIQLSGASNMTNKPLKDLIAYKKKVEDLEKEISHLKVSITNNKQFNNKVELNLKLKALEKKLVALTDPPNFTP